SVDVIASMLAVLKAGGAFVPMDPNFQVTRLESLVAEARPCCWLADAAHADRLRSVHHEQGLAATILPLAGMPAGEPAPATLAGATPLAPDSMCYVYFTSGSSGRPKGIAGRLKAIDHYVSWMTESFGVGAGSRFSQLISPAWDGFMLDAFVPLSVGGTVCVPEGREVLLDGARLHRWIGERRVGFIHCTPSLFRSILSQELTPADFPELRCVFLVGEVLLPQDVKRWHDVFGDRVQLVNLFGPSETTLTKLFYRVKPGDGEGLSIPIGQPMPGAKVVVVDEEGRPCSPGRLGEIYIRTPFRALGYLHQPELTDQVFVPNPFSGSADDIVYKTGDLGRWRADGNLEFEGRRDGQVKIRGIRIETAAIENLLRSHEAVADVAVTDRVDVSGNKFLCAYVVPRREVAADDLRQFLAGQLSEVMVPSAFVLMDALPRTITGKVDRSLLPSSGERGRLGRAPAPPRTPLESALCGIFRELLAVPEVGIRDSFFELGGHSLLMTLLVSRVRAAVGVEMPLMQVFQTPTVEQLAVVVADLQMRQGDGARDEIARQTAAGSWPVSFSQERLWIVDQMEVESAFNNICSAVRLTGALRVATLEAALQQVVARHDALRATFSRQDGQLAQTIAASRWTALPVIDLRALPEESREPEARRLILADMHEPFDLARGPLLRNRLVRLAERDHVMTCVMHHIVADWWSQMILVRETTALYQGLTSGRPAALPELPVRFTDFAVWQRQREELLREQLAYWRRQLAGAPAYLDLPLDFPRPPAQTFRGAQVVRHLPSELSDAAGRLGTEHGCTFFMVALAAYQILLHHHSGQDDLVVNTPVSGRNRRETEDLIGFFVNTLLLRARFHGDPTFGELLAGVRENFTAAYSHQEVPVDRVVEELAPARSLSYSPLLQASINVVDRDPLAGVGFSDLSIVHFDLDGGYAQYDLNLVLLTVADGLRVTLQYRTSLFRPGTVSLLLAQFEQLLRLATQHPAVKLSALRQALADEEEKFRRSEKDRLQHAGIHVPKRRRTASASLHEG
ncbi:MAG TPA: amino acid adenylation domain-containing protein, partial [Thermoanaerobaculia bacterium]|nr:amino acid adenylation domain-containing protein [Thermoanaerobaculia bacterium]